MRYLPLVLTAVLALATPLVHAQDGRARQRWPDASGSSGDAAPRQAEPRSRAADSPAPRDTSRPREVSRPREASRPRDETRPRETRQPESRARAARPADESGRAPAYADDGQRRAEPRGGRPRGDNPRTGTAVARRGPVPSDRDRDRDRDRYRDRDRDRRTLFVPRWYNTYVYYPYGYGGFALDYYYYDPSYWGGYGYTYDYGYRVPRAGGYRYGYGDPVGELRLLVRPRHAEVFVDGYYAGIVDDFDGMLQGLSLEEGPYRIEIVAPGFEPLEFDVRVQPGRKITYRGEMLPGRLRP